MSTFDILFDTQDDMRYKNHYNFFYFRMTPRGKSKFGITHLLWERLRMQQQGTDEEIQFDYAFLMKSSSKHKIDWLEDELKKHFQNLCIYKDTKRAGHTEWFQDISHEMFLEKFFELAKTFDIKIIEIANPERPYIATRSSECPMHSPSSGGKAEVQRWAAWYWKDIHTVTVASTKPGVALDAFNALFG